MLAAGYRGFGLVRSGCLTVGLSIPTQSRKKCNPTHRLFFSHHATPIGGTEPSSQRGGPIDPTTACDDNCVEVHLRLHQHAENMGGPFSRPGPLRRLPKRVKGQPLQRDACCRVLGGSVLWRVAASQAGFPSQPIHEISATQFTASSFPTTAP